MYLILCSGIIHRRTLQRTPLLSLYGSSNMMYSIYSTAP
jgi:hypothetical protein